MISKRMTERATLRILNLFCLGLGVGLGMFFLTSCFWSPARDLKSCQYRFQGVDFKSVDAMQTHWKLAMVVVNPNKRPVTLTRMNFSLLHQSDTLLTGMNPTQRKIANGDSQVIVTDLFIPNTIWKRLPANIWTNTRAEFTVTAGAVLDTWVGPIEVPGAMRQTIHVNMPEQMNKARDIMLQKLFSWPKK